MRVFRQRGVRACQRGERERRCAREGEGFDEGAQERQMRTRLIAIVVAVVVEIVVGIFFYVVRV